MDADFFAVLSRGGIWEISGGALADRPPPGAQNRVYLSFDEPSFYWDTGVEWRPVGASEAAGSILQKLLTVDGDDSGLNASMLRSLAPSDFARANDARIPTQGENDALQGTSGAPSAANRYLSEAEKNAASGLAGLGPDGKHLPSQTNSLAISRPFEVASQAAMLALDPAVVDPGDLAIRTDFDPDRVFMLVGEDTSVLANWVRVTFGDVVSVNGQVGLVVLAAGDIGFTPVGSLSSTTVAAALAELAAEKAAIDDPRLRTIRDEGAALTNRPILDFVGTGVVVEDDGAGGRTKVTISGAAAGLSSEEAAGVAEIATQTEIDAGTDDARIVTALKLANLPRIKNLGAVTQVQRGAVQAIQHNTFTPVSWDMEDRDDGGYFNPAVPTRVTPPPGVYVVTFSVSFAVNTTGVRTGRVLRYNSAGTLAQTDDMVNLSAAVDGAGRNRLAAVVAVSAGDYLIAEAYQSSGAALNLVGSVTPTFVVTKIK